MEEIVGYIERITFQNNENGYTVAHLVTTNPKINPQGSVCIVGILPSIQPGETVRCTGMWKRHLVHGQQFDVKEHRVETPADALSIKKYLSSGLIKGIGATYAGRIVDVFGVETLNVIDQTPEELLRIPGLGKKRLDNIIECWQAQKSIRDVMIFLQTYGVSPTYAQKIFKIYGAQSIEKVKANPYSLARDIHGIGFKLADKIAGQLGITANAPQRIDAGIEHLLHELSSEGHVCYPLEEFSKELHTILQIDAALIPVRYPLLKSEGRIEIFDLLHHGTMQPFIWSTFLFISETGIAREIKRLMQGKSFLRPIDNTKAITWAQQQLQIELAHNQHLAVSTALSEKMLIITGGPGTGKSTITNTLLSIISKLTPKVFLAAPTGRAAKRMSEITKCHAMTIHSMLEVNFKGGGGFKRNRDNPLDCDVIIIDEASMIDTYLMYSLLRAIPDHAKVILIGDINQLPSVGPGNVLLDMISSKTLPVIVLNEIFRQAAHSQIITNAHRINKGVLPDTSNMANGDFFFVHAESHEEVTQAIISLMTQRIPRKYGFNPLNDIQLLIPMKRGELGIENLNVQLQQVLNPCDNPLFRNGWRFHRGDKVMQIRNDYDKEVYNGDIGKIITIHQGEQQLTVLFDNKEVIYDFDELDSLVLAYAISVHKFQGSEAPCVVVLVHTSQFMMLRRNLLYTACTRGRKLVVIVGMKKALAIAVHNDDVKKRFSGLQDALISINLPPSQRNLPW